MTTLNMVAYQKIPIISPTAVKHPSTFNLQLNGTKTDDLQIFEVKYFMYFKCDGLRREYIERTSDIFSPMIIFPGKTNTTHGILGSFGTPVQPEFDL